MTPTKTALASGGESASGFSTFSYLLADPDQLTPVFPPAPLLFGNVSFHDPA